MSYFINTDLISCLLDLRLADPGSTLIHAGAYNPYVNIIESYQCIHIACSCSICFNFWSRIDADLLHSLIDY